MRNLLVIACLLIVQLPVSLHAGDKPIFTFGINISLTGEFEERGKKALAGIKLRVEDYNATLDPGQPVLKYIVRNDKSDPVVAKKNMQYFADKGIPAVIGPLASALLPGMREVAAEKHIAVISPCVTSPEAGKNKDWVCRLFFDDEFQGTVLARFLARERNIRSAAAIINDRLSYPNSVFNAFKKEFERLGGKIVAVEHHNWIGDEEDAYDFSTALNNINKARPDIVLLPSNPAEVVAVISQATMMGLELMFCGGDTWTDELIMLASGHGIEGAFYVTGINFKCSGAPMQRFRSLYEYSNDPDLQLSSVMGYDAVSLLIKALESGTGAEEIHEALYRIKKLKLAVGTVTIDPERGSEKTAYIQQIVKQDNGFVAELVREITP